jgi:hypothetical protein
VETNPLISKIMEECTCPSSEELDEESQLQTGEKYKTGE